MRASSQHRAATHGMAPSTPPLQWAAPLPRAVATLSAAERPPPPAQPQHLHTFHAVNEGITHALTLLGAAMAAQETAKTSLPPDSSCYAKQSTELRKAMVNMNAQLRYAVGSRGGTHTHTPLACEPYTSMPTLVRSAAVAAMIKQGKALRTSSAPLQMEAAQAVLDAMKGDASPAGGQTGCGLPGSRPHSLDGGKGASPLCGMTSQPLGDDSNGQALQRQGKHCDIQCDGQASAPRAAPPAPCNSAPQLKASSMQSSRSCSQLPKDDVRPQRMRMCQHGNFSW